LLSVATLITNDIYLKHVYPGFITGKLSDFSGIFLVSSLAFAILPRSKVALALLLTVAFAYWKSPLSEPLLDGLNSLITMRIGRVVDYTDLVALIAIPVAAICVNRSLAPYPGSYLRRLTSALVVFVSLVAVTGTSTMMPVADFSIRNSDPNSRLTLTDFHDAMFWLRLKYDLECESCTPEAPEGIYRSDDLVLNYWLEESENGIRFSIRTFKMKGMILAVGDYEFLERFRKDLKREFGKLAPTMEYVERLSNGQYQQKSD
jgi:hypothetical protein